MWQSRHVREQLLLRRPQLSIELRVIRTRGDTLTEGMLPVGAFTHEIQQALLDGEIDFAVHSLKDLPAQSTFGLKLAAVLPREDPSDALISRTGACLSDLPTGAKVMCGSPRRRAMLLHLRSDLELLPSRGNVDTRIKRFDESGADALVLAWAGLARLGLTRRCSCKLDPREFLPAAGQGALAVEVRSGDAEMTAIMSEIDDPVSRSCTAAERAMLTGLGTGCAAPVGAFCAIEDGAMCLRGMVSGIQGTRLLRAQGLGDPSDASAPANLGRSVAQRLLALGAADLLT
jgi:hydroxymethylbilane synthase